MTSADGHSSEAAQSITSTLVDIAQSALALIVSSPEAPYPVTPTLIAPIPVSARRQSLVSNIIATIERESPLSPPPANVKSESPQPAERRIFWRLIDGPGASTVTQCPLPIPDSMPRSTTLPASNDSSPSEPTPSAPAPPTSISFDFDPRAVDFLGHPTPPSTSSESSDNGSDNGSGSKSSPWPNTPPASRPAGLKRNATW